jgi:methyl-accepting chemotaxis protein
MSDQPDARNGIEMDEAKLAAIADYLGLTQEALERLQSLRDQVHETLNTEFNVVASDLIQLRRLLSDAAEKLSGTFRTVTAGSADLTVEIARLGDGGGPQSLARVREIATDMTATTGQTIQSLQFEDMATQLLQHVDKKLGVLARLSKDMAIINPTTARVPPLLRGEQLEELFARLEAYRTELAVSTRKVVQQESLESGDIELF